MRRPTPNAAATRGGLDALNTANLQAQLDTLIDSYFKIALPVKSVAIKRRKRPHSALEAADRDGNGDDTPTAESGLKRIKQFLKESKDAAHVQRVFDSVERQLSRATKHKTLLPLIVKLCEELFSRSSVFRSLVAKQMAAFINRLLSVAGEVHPASKRGSAQQRGGKSKQTEAVTSVLAMIETWRDGFGAKYPTIVACYDNLADMGYIFPCVVATNAAEQAASDARRVQQTALDQIKVKKMEDEMARILPEMELTLAEMTSIFDILVPTLEAFNLSDDDSAAHRESTQAPTNETEDDGVEWEDAVVTDAVAPSSEPKTEDSDIADEDDDGVEWEDVEEQEDDDDGDAFQPHDSMDINEIVQAYGLGSSSYQLTISIPTTVCEQSSENEALFTNLSDSVLQIRKRFLPLVRDWLQVADADAAALGAERDPALLTRLAGLQSRLERATLQWEDLVKESDRKRFATIQPRVVSLPSTLN